MEKEGHCECERWKAVAMQCKDGARERRKESRAQILAGAQRRLMQLTLVLFAFSLRVSGGFYYALFAKEILLFSSMFSAATRRVPCSILHPFFIRLASLSFSRLILADL